MKRRIWSLVGVAVAIVGAAACGGDVVTVCPADLRFTWSPRDTTIAPGEQFTASLQVFGCAGRDRLLDTVTFKSSDVSVAVVSTTSGVVIGAHPGTATIIASAKHYGVEGLITVKVR